MRAGFSILLLPLVAVVLSGCSKTASYRSYTCVCTTEAADTVTTTTDYGLHAQNLYEASYFCNDIEDRVTAENKTAGIDAKVSCELK